MSLERCPACRSRLADEPLCPRCGCDLTLVRRADSQSRRLFGQALQAWADGDKQQAQDLVQAGLQLKHEPLAAAVLQALKAA